MGKLAMKELRNTKFYAMVLFSVILVGIFSLSPAISSLMNDVIIRSTGRIATMAPIAYKSEIRGVFIDGMAWSYPHNWTIIVDTLKNYNITTVVIGALWFDGGAYEELGLAIAACHAQNIEVHVLMNFFYVAPSNHPELQAEQHDGTPINTWICPTKAGTRNVIKTQLEYVATNYDIDGFMYDYIRYVLADMCYCSECRAAFETWLGEEITDWNDFYPGGSRVNEFLEWRTVPITELVRDVRSWMLAIKPDLEFSAATFTLFQDSAIYWRKFMGQDTGKWVKNNYLDYVAPMMYTTDLAVLQDNIETNVKYLTSVLEGKIPLVCFISTGIETAFDPDDFKAVVDKVRELGADGWMIWRYGGPGIDDDDEGILFDITEYLDLIDLPDVLALNNIEVSPKQTEATFSWITELPTTSKVEYSTSPLFNATWSVQWGFNYWDIDHIEGTIVENSTSTLYHEITLTGLLSGTKYYFRVQSQDPSGIATSKVLTFTSES